MSEIDKDKDMERAKWGLIALALSPVTFFIAGWGVSTLWGWFIVPLGLPEIGKAHALGIGLMICLMRPSYPSENDTVAAAKSRLLMQFIVPPLAVLIGYIARMAM